MAAAVVGVLLGVSLTAVLGFVVVADGEGTPPVDTKSLAVVQVQNKVALGPDRLEEDSSPAYLSTVPIAYCAQPARSCKVPGTEMASGVALVANCQVQGQRMVNNNLSEVASYVNPDRADSSLWYRVTLPDGRSGYLSEVYIAARDRGGMGLPPCGPLVPTPRPPLAAGN